MSNNILSVDDTDFAATVLQARGPVLVDFWADWCGPCKALAPVLADIADEYPELRVVKIDADSNEATMAAQGVRGLPTLVLYLDGQERERVLGLTTKTKLADLVEKYLDN